MIQIETIAGVDLPPEEVREKVEKAAQSAFAISVFSPLSQVLGSGFAIGEDPTDGIVTAEEHTIYGGLGSAVAEVVATTHPVPMRILGVPGVFAPTGSPTFLFEHFGLTPQGICDAALELVDLRRSQ